MAYRKIDPKLWDDEKVAGLDLAHKAVWLYILTGPHTTSLPGLWVVGPASMAEGLRVDVSIVIACLETFKTLGLLEWDAANRLIRVYNAPRHNKAENWRVVQAWWNKWSDLPECALKYEHVASLREGVEGAKTEELWETTFGSIPRSRSEKFANAIRIVREPVTNSSPATASVFVLRSDQDPRPGSPSLPIQEEDPVTARSRVAPSAPIPAEDSDTKPVLALPRKEPLVSPDDGEAAQVRSEAQGAQDGPSVAQETASGCDTDIAAVVRRELGRHRNVAHHSADENTVGAIASQLFTVGVKPSDFGEVLEEFVVKRASNVGELNSDEFVRGFGGYLIAWKRRLKTPAQAMHPDARRALVAFEERWQSVKRAQYVRTEGDALEAWHVWCAAVAEKSRCGEPPEAIIKHWTNGYLRDSRTFIADANHPFRFLRKQISAYGLPPKKRTTLQFASIEKREVVAAPSNLAASIGVGGQEFVKRRSN